MDSSPGFGSHRRHRRLLQTRCPSGSPALTPVNLRRRCTRRIILQKARHHPDSPPRGQWALTAGEYVVSGSLSSPSRGAFHLSLTVLLHYRSLKVLSLGGWSPQLPTRFHVPRGTQDPDRRDPPVLYWTLTISGAAFQAASSRRIARVCVGPTTPDKACAPPGLGSSRFARHYYGNLV